MADSTQGDTMVLYLGLLAPALITLIAGLVIHSFIIVVNVNDWRKGRSVTPVDYIVTFLAISRMVTECVVMPYLLGVRLFLKDPDINVVAAIIDLIYAFSLYGNFWVASLLSIVFCVKISGIRTRLFLYLRRMIEQRTVHFIVFSGLLSIFSCLLPLLMTDMTNGGIYNTTIVKQLLDCTNADFIYSFNIASFIPLLFYVISSVVLFSSLYHHTRRMKMSGNLSINLETYYSAMKFVSFTLLYNTIYFSGHFVNTLYYYLYCDNLVQLHIVLECLPPLHSSYLIYRTVKLRSQMSKVLQTVYDLFFHRKDLETREGTEVVAQ